MAQGYPTQEQLRSIEVVTAPARAEGSRRTPVSAVTYLRMLLAEIFPVGLFALGLLLAIDRFGLIGGVVLGSILAGALCWLLGRLIAASPVLQWIGAAFVLIELAWVIVSFV